jgi:Collagen triple helix repeat (20 copies)
MFNRFRERFGTAGLIVAIVALVAAVGGTALAASGALTAKQKKEVKAIAKSFQGTGPAGAQGAPGSPGANGKDGAAGTAGTNGKDGTNGTNGTDGDDGEDGSTGATGKSVETGTEATGTGNCAGLGGATVQVAGEPATKKYACNGKEGSPWTAGGTLPAGKTETGSWSIGSVAAIPEDPPLAVAFTPISFTIPLAAPLASTNAHYIKANGEEKPALGPEKPPVDCGIGIGPGINAGNPKAKPGHLCIYAGLEYEATSSSGFIFNSSAGPGVDTAGASVGFSVSAKGAIALGTWAVTAP